MIGSHNSYTHLKSTKAALNLVACTGVWKCQESTVTEQYKMGVRFFDVRVRRDVIDGINVWRVCHGVATVEKAFVTLKSICLYFEKTLKNSMYRIVLETDDAKEDFLKEVEPLIKNAKEGTKYTGLIEVITKKPTWEVVYWAKNHPSYKDYCYEFWDFNKGVVDNIVSILKRPTMTLKKYAKAHNPKITQEMIDDPNTIHIMDYVDFGFAK